MSFEGYLRNIEAKTGTTPEQFRQLAESKGLATANGLAPGIKAGQIIAWLKADFGLGHGHAMAIVALLKGSKSLNLKYNVRNGSEADTRQMAGMGGKRPLSLRPALGAMVTPIP